MDEMIAMNSTGETSLFGTCVYVLDVPEKPSGVALREQVALAARSGFNALLLPVFRGGYTLFPSRVASDYHLPAIRPDLKKVGDIFLDIFEAASEHDLAVFAYADILRVGDRRIHEFGPIIARRKKWAAMNKRKTYAPIGASQNDLFLCLNNPEVRRFSADLLIEIVESFPVTGIVVDMHTYPFEYSTPDEAACFCDYCRRAVKEELKIEPASLSLKDEDAATTLWKAWKKECLTKYMAYLSGRLREARFSMPFLLVIPGEFPMPGADSFREIQSSATTWINDGLITSLIARYPATPPFVLEATIEGDLHRIADDAMFAPMFQSETLSRLADYLRHLAPLPLWGYFISLAYPLNQQDAERLSHPRLTRISLDSPMGIFQSARTLIEHLIGSTGLQPALNSFLNEVRAALVREETPTFEQIQDIIEDLRTLEEKFHGGDIDSVLVAPETLRHLSLIKRLLKVSIINMRAQTVHS